MSDSRAKAVQAYLAEGPTTPEPTTADRHVVGENGHSDGICDRCAERFEQRAKEDPELAQRAKNSMAGADEPSSDRARPTMPQAKVPTVEVPRSLVHRILGESIDQPLPQETWDALDALCRCDLDEESSTATP